MASKKTVRVSKLTKLKDYNALVLSDVHCPICRSILIEPVSLPCNHDFCLFCFEGTMENANLVCPLCRLRIGSWLRRARKDNILINGKLWKAIKEGFPIHVKNKLDGVDENLEEKREIIVAYPGEIRNEYEMQKQKEDEEQSKRREKEIKASEELIKTLTEEDDYQKAVMEEKLKVDEEMAKKLSEELTAKHPSTSKMKTIYKKQGPMDKFVKKDNETTNLNSNTFANKEYTCRVLCLDSGTSSNESSVNEFSSKMHKKMQQLQKIVDLETTRDGSDCIESEMRYFKPIDYRSNPPTQRKTPLKVTPQKLPTDASAKVLSPGGLINFCSNILESAFARFSIDMPKTPNASKITSVSSSNSNKETFSVKRTLSSNDLKMSDKKLKKDTTESQENYSKSPILDHNKRKNFFKNTVKLTKKEVESPPFYGFDRTKPGNQKNRKNGRSVEDKSYISKLKKDQEQADLEFAKRLQEEINKSHYTRSSRHLSISKRQKTLDEMIKSPYRVK